MQPSAILHPPRQVASAFIAILVVIAAIAIVASVLILTAPRPAATTPDAAVQAWLNFRSGERGDTVAPDASQQAWRDYRSGERGDKTP